MDFTGMLIYDKMNKVLTVGREEPYYTYYSDVAQTTPSTEYQLFGKFTPRLDGVIDFFINTNLTVGVLANSSMYQIRDEEGNVVAEDLDTHNVGHTGGFASFDEVPVKAFSNYYLYYKCENVGELDNQTYITVYPTRIGCKVKVLDNPNPSPYVFMNSI